ncbi:2Fe-2S iron-sulfur cluster-binding protein [Cupriavidus consociatus]|uniref:2Fe-2S iron-sulfur cluster-binding protein n=1 Tax=Cupriavidus consociatus TaxID=2821357 RepID=UPI0024DF5E56|nr:2Fe-2S iron-sulfur cluster-binding protein [Cupriavidus sp. LEh21]MDK2660393.1 2Fe-2S iron-sulfur cluster-binding protein [Cupriavidus sp. LEh21]
MERFTQKEKTASQDSGATYRVTLSRSGAGYEVAQGKSILDTLLDAGVDVPHGCKQGICGACKTQIVRGEPDHRDSVLSASERTAGNVMMVCVSGCKSEELVLDI